MSATATAKAVGPLQSPSPKKEGIRPPPPTKPNPATTTAADHSSTPANATAKGSRRAQGWHSAIGGGAGGVGSASSSGNGIRETHSNLDGKGLMQSRVNSSMPRRSSVQFSEDALNNNNNNSSPRATSKSRSTASSNKDDAAFRQSMADFLTVMYGDRKTNTGGDGTNATAGKGRDDGSRTSTTAGGATAKGNIPKVQRSGSPHLPPSGVKGPLVKGLTANGSRQATGDRIDTLVDTLVRAYSLQVTSSRSDFHGTSGSPDDDNPISYNRPRNQNYRRAVASPRLGRGSGAGSGHSGVDTNEVSLFVSQAMDGFIGPAGLRQQGLPSTRSVLSSLGVDKNVFGLMSFQTKSNMQEVDAAEDESDTKLEPMYVGEQALFKSVGTRPNMNDISVSKSMRGVIPVPAELGDELGQDSGRPGGAQRRVSSGVGSRRTGSDSAKSHLNNSNLSLDSAVQAGTTRNSNASQHDSSGGPRVATRGFGADGHHQNNKSMTRCMSLDSKALGVAAGRSCANGGGNDDDSWGDDAGMTASGAVVVSSARSLLDYSKARHSAAFNSALHELLEEEQLKRDVVAAVEHQLRGYIVSLEAEERTKKKTG
jgi:hypothetical protein